MGPWLLALLALTPVARGASIRDVDFKYFSFPFAKSRFDSVPGRPRWMPIAAPDRVPLHDGHYSFACADPPCDLITFDQATFGEITGLVGEVALVTTVFHTGGTANWKYLYVVTLRAGKPKVLAWMEAGSRADMGLRSAATDHGDLVLVFNDPDKREGDCCSTGSLTYRYRWVQGAFRQIRKPVTADNRP